MKTSGNAFIYILISVLLLGALSFAISRGNDSNPSAEISDAGVKASVTAILSYEAQARSALDRMVQNGANVSTIDFSLPGAAGFNTAPTITKLFHPDGGGFQYKPLPKSAPGNATTLPANGYYVGRFNNFEWTPTSSQDVVFSAYGISQVVCQALNRKTTGSAAIPVPGSGTLRQYTVDAAVSSAPNLDMTVAVCAACNGLQSLCIADGALPASKYVYYSILVSR